MENEKLQINLAPGSPKAEIIIREVKEVNELKVKPPVQIDIAGTVGAVYEFLLKRQDQSDQINQKRCHIFFNRDQMLIQLIIHENDSYLKGSVLGTMSLNPKFEEFGINTGKVWIPTELGMFLKMNRAFFPNRAENMKLVTELMNFTATVNNVLERSLKESGDRKDNFSQVVNSNLPASFSIVMPIFKGSPSETIEIETFAKVNGREVSFSLISPGAAEIIEMNIDKAIDEQLDLIRKLCPEIAIIEQ
jgi:hypothetical protein